MERLVRQCVGQSHSIQDFLCENILKPLHMGWTHFKAIIPMADPLKPDFYAEIFGIKQWSTPTMRNYRRCKVMNYMQSRVADTYAHGLTNSTGAKRA